MPAEEILRCRRCTQDRDDHCANPDCRACPGDCDCESED